MVVQSGTSSDETGAFPGDGQVLAWKAESDHAARGKVVRPGGTNIVQNRRVGPLGRQQLAAPLVLLDLGDNGEPRALEAEVESADAGE